MGTEADDPFCLLAVRHKGFKPPKAGRSPVGTNEIVRGELFLPSPVQFRKVLMVLARF